MQWSITTQVLMIIFMLIAQLATGQEYLSQYRALTTEDGLPTKWTHCFEEDNQNLIWIGTQKGVSRYDGLRFVNYNRDNSPLRLKKVDILLKDSKGHIWVSRVKESVDFRHSLHQLVFHPDHIDIIDPISLKISSFDQYFEHAPITEGEIEVIDQVEDGIWVVTKDKRHFLYSDGWQSFPKIDGRVSHYDSIQKDKYGFLAIADNQAEFLNDSLEIRFTIRIDPAYRISRIEGDDLLYILAKSKKVPRLYKLFQLQDSSKLVDVTNRFFSKEEIEILSAARYHLHPISWNSGNTFLGVGQYIVSTNDRPVGEDRLISGLLDTRDINHTFQDSYNNLWISASEGIRMVQQKSRNFQSYLSNGPELIETRALFELDEKIIVGAYSGIYSIDPGTNKVMFLQPHSGAFLSALSIDENQILLTYPNRQISYLQKSNFKEIETFQDSKFPLQMTHAMQTRDGQIYIGSKNGLVLWDMVKEEFITDLAINRYQELGNREVRHIYENDLGVWVATNQGLFLVEGSTTEIFNVANGVLPYDRLQYIFEDNEYLWIATSGGGIIRFDPQTTASIIYNTDNGLSNDFVHAIYKDADGYYWLPTDNGLNRFDPRTKEFQIYTERDGIANNEFNKYSHVQTSNGHLYFGGVDGVTAFNPLEVNRKSQNNYTMVLTGFDVLDEDSKVYKTRLEEYVQNNTIILAPDDQYIRVAYSLTDFMAGDDLRFSYRIKGLSNDWDFTKSNQIQLSKPPYGSYQLEVRGQSVSGSWSKNILSIPFEVKRPFYATNAFILIMVGGLLALIYGGVKWRLSYLRRSNLKLKEDVKIRTMEIQAINRSKDKLLAILAHDLKRPVSNFSNLSQKVQYLVSKKDWKTLDEMTDQIRANSNNLMGLINNLIPWVMSQIKNEGMEQKEVQVAPVVSSAIHDVRPALIEKGIRIVQKVDENAVVVANESAMQIILRNLLDNSIKYSSSHSEIQVYTSKDNGHIAISVQDFGAGMDVGTLEKALSEYKSEPGTLGEKGHGLGLKLSRDLAISNNGTLSITSRPLKGTTAILKLPRV